jgi:hypothetical protein
METSLNVQDRVGLPATNKTEKFADSALVIAKDGSKTQTIQQQSVISSKNDKKSKVPKRNTSATNSVKTKMRWTPEVPTFCRLYIYIIFYFFPFVLKIDNFFLAGNLKEMTASIH